MLGELLITAEDKQSPTQGRREVKRALWANMISDSVDVVSISYAFATSTLALGPTALLGGAGGSALLLGAVAMKTLH